MRVRRFQGPVLEMAGCIGPKFAGTVMRQVLKDTPMHLTQMRDIELPLHGFALEFANPCKG